MPITAATSPIVKKLQYHVYYDLDSQRFPAKPTDVPDLTIDLIAEGIIMIEDIEQCPLTFAIDKVL